MVKQSMKMKKKVCGQLMLCVWQKKTTVPLPLTNEEWVSRVVHIRTPAMVVAFLHRGRLMLCREKDELLNEFAFVQGSREEIDTLPTIGRRDGRFGTEAIVRRTDIPAGMKTSPVTIEDLFVFMAKEEGR